jgi:hypothetical protein
LETNLPLVFQTRGPHWHQTVGTQLSEPDPPFDANLPFGRVKDFHKKVEIE